MILETKLQFSPKKNRCLASDFFAINIVKLGYHIANHLITMYLLL